MRLANRNTNDIALNGSKIPEVNEVSNESNDGDLVLSKVERRHLKQA